MRCKELLEKVKGRNERKVGKKRQWRKRERDISKRGGSGTERGDDEGKWTISVACSCMSRNNRKTERERETEKAKEREKETERVRLKLRLIDFLFRDAVFIPCLIRPTPHSSAQQIAQLSIALVNNIADLSACFSNYAFIMFDYSSVDAS